MSLMLLGFSLCAALFVLMVAASEVGRRIGIARVARHGGALAKGAGSAEAATFALLGLLIAFTFSGAAERFQDRRDLIADEANRIGTAYLRLDLLPSDAQPPLRDLFRRYADARTTVYAQVLDDSETEAKAAESVELQGAIWTMARAAAQREGVSAVTAPFVLGAINEMIDITTARTMATQSHPPLIVFILLVGFSVVCALLVGYTTSENTARSWLHTLTFPAIVSLTIYVIIDIEFPRVGLVRVDTADEFIREVREAMQ